MPLPGGASAKTGMRYESLWTVHCMTRVLTGDADSILLEPPGETGAEFCVKTRSGIEYHQVKRQISGEGRWSLKTLDSRGVLGYFYRKLDNPSATCVFVSGHSAHPLDELASRARDAGSYRDFCDTFLSSDLWSKNFSDLRYRWGNAEMEDAYQRLKRVCVRTLDENGMRELVMANLEFLVNESPENALDVLSEFALQQIHRTLDSAAIWRHLEYREFSKRAWGQSVADSIHELTESYAAGIQPSGIGGEVVDREELGHIFSVLDGDEKRVALVTGKAGAGKSSLMQQAISEARTRGWIVLALRVDRMEPRLTSRDVGVSLGLPASPANSLAGVAGGRDCLLAVDQMDAVSLASGRSPDFFDCIGAVLKQACHHPKMRVISACRKFDLDNDHRLRHLVGDGGIAREVPLGSFDEATVRKLAANLGLNAAALSPRQVELLSLPIHLRLLSESTADGGVSQMGFRTTKDLYDRFRRSKWANLERLGLEYAHIQNVTDLMLEYMNDREVLFVPDSRLDEHERIVSAMASENLIVRDGSRVSFFHESFFDYLFARSVAGSGDFNLAAHVIDRNQSLFIRSQVRQILLHQREASPQDALRNAKRLLTGKRIRPHLKSIVISLLGSLDDPNKEEWETLEPLLDSEMSSHVWGAINGSPPWFDLLDRLGIIRRWLANGALADRAAWFLYSVHKDRPDAVAKSLSPYICQPAPWDKRLMGLITRFHLGSGRELFDMAVRVVETGALDGWTNAALWNQIDDLAKTKPDWACELTARCLDRLLTSSSDVADPHGVAGRIIRNLAEVAPEKFAAALMPFALKAAAMDRQDPAYLTWNSHIYVDGYEDLGKSFFMAMESAMRQLAQNRPDSFRAYAESLKASTRPPLRRLLVRSYEANGDRFADEAVEYIVACLSILAGGGYIDEYEAAGQLIKSVTPYCSPENLARLERAVLEYCPEWERRESRFSGYSQLRLLKNIAPSRLSDKVSGRLRELRRKFPDAPPPNSASGVIVGGAVPSPIPEDSARKMSDDNWLGAINRYPSDLPSFASDDGLLVGGVIELSRVLETLAKERPARFADLVHRMPDDANVYYFEAVLKGIFEAVLKGVIGSDLDEDAVVDACLRCHKISSRPLGIPIVRLLGALPNVPEKGLEMIAWYATESPDPEPPVSRDILTEGINSGRGAAAESVAQLVFKGYENFEYFKPLLKGIANDPSIAVRACAAHVLLGVLNYDRDLAVELFVDLCGVDGNLRNVETPASEAALDAQRNPILAFFHEGRRSLLTAIRACFGWLPMRSRPHRDRELLQISRADERLLSSHYVEMFLKYALSTHYERIEPILMRMVVSDDEEVATVGARQACLASLTNEDALDLARRCVSAESKSLRIGAAEVYSRNLRLSEFRAPCEEALGELFSDPDPEVRRAATACFLQFKGQELRDYPGLIESYMQSDGFDSAFNPLFTALKDTTAYIPDTVLTVCEKLLGISEPGNPTPHEYEIPSLIIRVYRSSTDPETKSRCLALIDRLAILGVFELDRAMGEFER